MNLKIKIQATLGLTVVLVASQAVAVVLEVLKIAVILVIQIREAPTVRIPATLSLGISLVKPAREIITVL